MTGDFAEIKEKEDRYQLNTYAKLPISIERGEGVYVYGSDGKRYLDLYGGHAVALVGHCHPAVVRAVQEQAGSSSTPTSSIRPYAPRPRRRSSRSHPNPSTGSTSATQGPNRTRPP